MKSKAWNAFGYTIGYRSSTCDVEATLAEIVLPSWLPADPKEADCWVEIRGLEIYDDDQHWTTARDYEHLLLRLQQLSQMKLTWGSPQTVFLHCGVVKVRDSVWCIPGDSKAGKSTLVRALCEHGAIFYSDEYAPIDEQGWVHPYPRSLWTRVSRHKREKVRPEQLGWHRDLGPLPISRVLFCPFRRGLEWAPQTLTAAEAAREAAALLKVHPARREAALERLELAFGPAERLKGCRPEVEIFLPGIWE